MVDGPQGFLGYRGRTPGYSGLIKGVTRVLRLRTRAVRRAGDRFLVD